VPPVGRNRRHLGGDSLRARLALTYIALEQKDREQAMRTFIFVALIGLTACLPNTNTYEKGQRDISDRSRIDQIQKGSITKDNILVLFGQHEGKSFEADGDETWSYTYVSREPRSPFLASPSQVHSAVLIVTFDNRGTVKSYSTSGS
jgi:outer membrane protein assembly factor BamE (lipoprotein component of BamABCDE complex)